LSALGDRTGAARGIVGPPRRSAHAGSPRPRPGTHRPRSERGQATGPTHRHTAHRTWLGAAARPPAVPGTAAERLLRPSPRHQLPGGTLLLGEPASAADRGGRPAASDTGRLPRGPGAETGPVL